MKENEWSSLEKKERKKESFKPKNYEEQNEEKYEKDKRICKIMRDKEWNVEE